jgi:hypothetical protein
MNPLPTPPSIALTERRLIAVSLAGAFILMLAFALSYVGAFHEPTPHRIPVAVVAPRGAGPLAARLDALPGHPLRVSVASSTAQALRAIDDRTSYGAYDAAANRLYVASAANRATATAVELTFERALAGEHRAAATVTDIKPLPNNDPNGTTLFYAVVALVFGGYVAATVLRLMVTAPAATRRQAAGRLAALTLFAALGGPLTVVAMHAAFGVFAGHVLAMSAVAALIVLASAVAASGVQAVAGIPGTGLVLLLFVIVGNAASGGPYARPLLPGFWRAVGSLLPPGAGVDLARGVLFFGGSGVTAPALVLAAWAVLGAALTFQRLRAAGATKRVALRPQAEPA